MSAGEWIEWAGGECPLEPGTQHVLKFRDGQESYGIIRAPVTSIMRRAIWSHDGGAADIVAYRVVQS